MKLFILFCVLATALSAEIAKKEHIEEIKSSHIPASLQSVLKLTPGELKLFAGHALTMIRSKCPSVDGKKIFQLQKYIGKVIAVAKDNEKKEKGQEVKTEKPQFSELLVAIKTCSDAESKNVKPKKLHGGISFIVRNPGGDVTIIHGGEGHKKIDPANKEGKNGGIVLGFDDDEVNANGDKNQKKRHHMNGWASSIFDRVFSFFSHVFHKRVRRSTDLAFPVEPKSTKGNKGRKWIKMDKIKGKNAIITIGDEMCRIFCDTCHSPLQATLFKMAAKELTQYINKDEDILIAASHVLDEDLVNSIGACTPDARLPAERWPKNPVSAKA